MNIYTQKKPYQKSILIISIISMLVLLTSCGKQSQEGGRENQNFVYSIAATTIKPQFFEERITLGGSIQAKNAVSIIPDTGGTLTRILVYEGAKVKKGQIIAYVDSSKAGQNFLPSPVRTSITGIVSSLPTKVGNSITAQQIIATVADNSEIEMSLAIPEKYVGKITPNTRGKLSVIAFPDKVYDMKVKTMSSVLSEATHTMPVTMSFTEEHEELKSGMYGSIDIILDEKTDAFVVQRNTVIVRLIDNKNRIGVFLIKPQEEESNDIREVYFQEVGIGIENNNKVEIISGLKEGDLVITQGQESLSNGDNVRIFVLDGETLIRPEDEVKRLQEGSKDLAEDKPAGKRRRMK